LGRQERQLSANETGVSQPCEQLLLQISRDLDGDLAPHEKVELATHLTQCASCRLRAIELGAADALFRLLETKCRTPAATVTQQIMERLRLETATAGGVLAFSRLVAQDPDLQNQFRPATTPELFAELFVNLGWQRGYHFGRGEVVSLLAARRAANDDLSDEQLDAVVGGTGAADAAWQTFVGNVFQKFFRPNT